MSGRRAPKHPLAINVLQVLQQELGMSPRGAKCVLSYGQVYLNDRQLGPTEYAVPRDEAQGGFIHVLGRCTRLGQPPARFTEDLFEDQEPGMDDLPPHAIDCECERCEEWWGTR